MTITAKKRLLREYAQIQKEKPDYIITKPLEENILEWHYVIHGPPDSVYHGGEYHGVVIFPDRYPFAPPMIKMITPSGRFVPNQRICLTISDYHPESWNPIWNIGTILTGLLSFMLEDEHSAGCYKSSTFEKKEFAKNSQVFNRNNQKFKGWEFLIMFLFLVVFPELCVIDGTRCQVIDLTL